jgi:EEF1A lysine methyltransferase 2
MVGVDYSAESVQLATRIWEEIVSKETGDGDEDKSDDTDQEDDEKPAPSKNPIIFETLDILSLASDTTILPTWLPTSSNQTQGVDVLLDKGTFDAVSLSADTDATGRRVCETYAVAAQKLLRDGGLLVVTSCNWTEDELKAWFCQTEGSRLELVDRVPYPRFKFGGVEGQTVVGAVFRKGGGSG